MSVDVDRIERHLAALHEIADMSEWDSGYAAGYQAATDEFRKEQRES